MTEISSTGSAVTNSQAGQAASQLSVDYENFLKLLTAQIENQDPLQPMESTEFVSQLAQLTQVEQSIQTNSNLEAITASMAQNSAKIDLGLLGHEVVIASDKLSLGPDGARLSYELADSAAQITITLRDASGAIVRRLSGSSGTAGERHEIIWDGLSETGEPLTEGVYQMSLSALNGAGEPVSGQTYAQTGVEAVSLGQGGAILKLANGETLQPAAVLEVR